MGANMESLEGFTAVVAETFIAEESLRVKFERCGPVLLSMVHSAPVYRHHGLSTC